MQNGLRLEVKEQLKLLCILSEDELMQKAADAGKT